jgi:hypothetical protein
MAEWQLNRMRGRAAAFAIVFRRVGLMFVVGAITILFSH